MDGEGAYSKHSKSNYYSMMTQYLMLPLFSYFQLIYSFPTFSRFMNPSLLLIICLEEKSSQLPSVRSVIKK